jgi:hypothetical protein
MKHPLAKPSPPAAGPCNSQPPSPPGLSAMSNPLFHSAHGDRHAA